MDRIDTVKVPKRLPRPAAAGDVKKVLAAICPCRPRKDLPVDRLRDRVLFETIYVCGARGGEVCGLYVEDLDLRLDDEHVRIHGKGGTVRTVLLDDRGYFAELYEPFDKLLFFGASADGDQFAYQPDDPAGGIFVWEHETDERGRVADDLADYLRRRLPSEGDDWYSAYQ